MFHEVIPGKIYQQINKQIQELILGGALKKGDKLPPERQLAEALNVSRASIRESFRSLEIMGLIESRPGEGNFIASCDNAIIFEPLSIMFKLNNGKFRDILEIRMILEVEAAGLAAERITDDQLELLQTLMEDLEQSDNENHSVEIDKKIHYLIAESTGNFLIITMLDAISSLMTDFIANARLIIAKNISEQGRLTKIHKDVVKALCQKNPRLAQDAMRRHFYSVWESIENEEM
ncbi:MAG: FadR family transcriptional regulator [Tissierellales bacterium]|nr:FadR family transcriptional regulator [Tissierellales bacterium]MBN2827818.1 FadR family transcriptional regulator [Tissierellales bacterium]